MDQYNKINTNFKLLLHNHTSQLQPNQPLSSRQRTQPNEEDILTSSLFLFLSLIHENNDLLQVFKEKAHSKDNFMMLFQKHQYQQVLLLVFQTFNTFYLEIFQKLLRGQHDIQPQQIIKHEPIKIQERYLCTYDNQKIQPNLKQLQDAISGIIKNDLSPLRARLLRDKNLAQSNQKSKSHHQEAQIQSFNGQAANNFSTKNQMFECSPSIDTQDISPIIKRSIQDKTDINTMEKIIDKITASKQLKHPIFKEDSSVSRRVTGFFNDETFDEIKIKLDKYVFTDKKVQPKQCLTDRSSHHDTHEKVTKINSGQTLNSMIEKNQTISKANSQGSKIPDSRKDLNRSPSVNSQSQHYNSDLNFISIDDLPKKKKFTDTLSRRFDIISNLE